MAVAKRQGSCALKNRTKEGPRTGVRTSGKTNSTPGWPSLYRAGSGGGGQTYKERSHIGLGGFSSRIFWVSTPHTSRMYFPLLSK